MNERSWAVWEDGTDEEKYQDVVNKFKRSYLDFEALVFATSNCSLSLRLQCGMATSKVEEIWIVRTSEYKGQPFWYFSTYHVEGTCESWILEDAKGFILDRVGAEMLPRDRLELKALNEESIKERISMMIDCAYEFGAKATEKVRPKDEEEESK